MANTLLRVNDVYSYFNDIIRSDEDLSLTRKADAFNEGYLYLLEKMINMAGGIDELEVSGYWAPPSPTVNYATGPYFYYGEGLYFVSDYRFYKHKNVFGQTSGSAVGLIPSAKYDLFSDEANIGKSALDKLVSNLNFLGVPTTTGNLTGDVEKFAWSGDRLYFDRVLTLGLNTKFFVRFWTMPNHIVFTNSARIVGDLLEFLQIGDTIIGSTSGAIATIYSTNITLSAPYESDNISVYKSSINGDFIRGEEITSPNHSGFEAFLESDIHNLTEELQVPNKYKNILSTAIAVTYYMMRRLPDEAASLDLALDDMVKSFSAIKNQGASNYFSSRRRRA